MKSFFADLLRYGFRWIRNPNSRIAFSTRIGPGVSLGAGVRVDSQSQIYHSVLGNNVWVKERCGIAGSVLFSDNSLGAGCGLYNTKMGRFSYAGENTKLINVDVGSFCSLSADVVCGYDQVHHPSDAITTHPVFYSGENKKSRKLCNRNLLLPHGNKIIVGSDVLIGYRALVRQGVHIGDGAIVGAGAVVTRDVPSYAIVAGVPAKIIRYRFSEKIIERLVKIRWWDWDEGRLSSAREFLAQNDPELFLEWAQMEGES